MDASDHNGKPGRVGLSQIVEVCLEPAHLRRTVIIALIVGTWLTMLNQGGAGRAWDGELLLRMTLNYLTPFVVSNLGLLSKEPDDPGDVEH